mmetsp:Transcript_5499/g.13220  ORF Transcript_5499/g.13220 Transcript_5499/m.13220 type:complete len:287 (+) Transcript_5499:157-1017(+)
MDSVPWLQLLIADGSRKKLGQRLLLALLALASLRLMTRRKRLAGSEAPGGERTFVSKEALPYLLAFVAGWYDVSLFQQYKAYANMMTGNTLNLFLKVGNGDSSDALLLAGTIANFAGGFTAFKCLDGVLKGKGSCTAAAPVVFALFALADRFRRARPKSRNHMLLLAVAGGIINCISADKAKQATNMMTGHYQKLSGDLAEYLLKGLTPEKRASASLSCRVVATFCAGVTLGMAAWNVKHPFEALSKHRFAIFGGVYAGILVLHELPFPEAHPTPDRSRETDALST